MSFAYVNESEQIIVATKYDVETILKYFSDDINKILFEGKEISAKSTGSLVRLRFLEG